MSSSPISRVVHYRGRSDTGTVDGTPTWIAAEDTPFSVTVGTAFRLRISVENTGTATDTITQPQDSPNPGYERCGHAAGTYATLANVINSADAGSSTDAANVTVQRLTSGTGSFATGTAGYDENETLACVVTNGQFTEAELGIVFTGGASTIGVGGGESWALNVGGLTNAPLNIPTATTPNTDGTNFQHGAQLGGSGASIANSASLSMTTAAAASSGNLVVVVVACDNNSTTDGDFSEVSGVTIGGNAATKAIEFTNGQTAANAGCTCSVWYLQLAGNLASSSTITATFTTATTSGDACCMQAREYVVTAGKTISVEATASQATDAATQPTSLNATTSSIECLRICAHSAESSMSAIQAANTTRASNRTWSLWWTSGSLARMSTVGGTAASNQLSIVESTITTGTGAASQIGSVQNAGDWASCYVAFRADTVAAYEPKPLDMAGADITWSRRPIGY